MPRVLLVEDTPDVRSLLILALEEDGHQVVSVKTRSAALDVLRSEAIDMIVTDVMLPDGDGRSLSKEAQRRGAPTLLITGDIRAIEALGSHDQRHLIKPFGIDAFLAAVASTLAAGALGKESSERAADCGYGVMTRGGIAGDLITRSNDEVERDE